MLYDADEHGELLHFFTEVVGDRLFFEVLERRGGYDGYGAANAPVRMAAQRPVSRGRRALIVPRGTEAVRSRRAVRPCAHRGGAARRRLHARALRRRAARAPPSMAHHVREHAARHPARVLATERDGDGRRELTWGAARAAADALAQGLLDRGWPTGR